MAIRDPFGTHNKGYYGSDPRSGKRSTGLKDSSVLITGDPKSGSGPGFGQAAAFDISVGRSPVAAPKTYDQTYASESLRLPNMTPSERRAYQTSSMGIAPTKMDDYSDWGKARKKAADEAHARGELSAEEKRDKITIDTRDADRYKFDVVDPELQKQGLARAKTQAQAAFMNNRQFNLDKKLQTSMASASGPSATGSGRLRRSKFRAGSRGLGGAYQPKTRDPLAGHKKYGLDTSDPTTYSGPTQQKIATLVKAGYDPQLAATAEVMPWEEYRTHIAMPSSGPALSKGEVANLQSAGRGFGEGNARPKWTVK